MERIPNRSLISFLAVLLASVTLAPTAAGAADDGVVERVVVRNRQFRTEGAFEVSPMVGFSVTNRMTSTTN
ncbi:MAG TPA: outer membrane beta-barrel domain-containing protein, partial [Vulgatibacter sp.]|nr:outer membrane beta-barrel domain-containing protein [Vulgatibacter sp.]